MKTKIIPHRSFHDEEVMSKEDKKGSGEIWVNKFTEESASFFREHVIAYALKDPDMPIIIYIDSYGGAVYT